MTDRQDFKLHPFDDSFLVFTEEDLRDVFHDVEARCPEEASDEYGAGYGDGVFAVLQTLSDK